LLSTVKPNLVGQVALQVMHRLTPSWVWSAQHRASPEQSERRKGLVQLYARSAQVYLSMGQAGAAARDALAALNIGDHVPECADYPRACTMMIALAYWRRSRLLARVCKKYVERGRTLAQGYSGEGGTTVSFIHLNAAMLDVVLGRYNVATESFKLGSSVAFGDFEYRNYEFCEGSLALLCLIGQGDVAQSALHTNKLLTSASTRNDPCAFGHAIEAYRLILDDRPNLAMSILEKSALLDDYIGIALLGVLCAGNSVDDHIDTLVAVLEQLKDTTSWLDCCLKILPTVEVLVREYSERISFHTGEHAHQVCVWAHALVGCGVGLSYIPLD
jgi:hypothetical protein